MKDIERSGKESWALLTALLANADDVAKSFFPKELVDALGGLTADVDSNFLHGFDGQGVNFRWLSACTENIKSMS